MRVGQIALCTATTGTPYQCLYQAGGKVLKHFLDSLFWSLLDRQGNQNQPA